MRLPVARGDACFAVLWSQCVTKEGGLTGSRLFSPNINIFKCTCRCGIRPTGTAGKRGYDQPLLSVAVRYRRLGERGHPQQPGHPPFISTNWHSMGRHLCLSCALAQFSWLFPEFIVGWNSGSILPSAPLSP